MSLAESLESAAAEALAGILPVEAPTPVEVEAPAVEAPEVAPEDVPEEVAEVPAPEADAEPEAEVEAEPEAKEQDGYVKVPVVSDKLATEFTIRDAEGEIEVPDVIIEYKANGKVRKDRLDQVVKLAQFGVYNEERERKVAEAEHTATALSAETQALTKTLEEREAQLERILTDDDFLAAVREAYERENSPEQRVVRAEQEAKELRVEREYAPVFAAQESFNESEVVPALEMMVRALPTLSMEELEGKLQMAANANAETAPTGTRYIPASRFDAIRQYIVEDLAVWAQMQHARRSESRPSPAVATAPTELDKARIEAQKAKRVVGQATKPMNSANGKVAPKKAKPPANIAEAQEQAENAVLAALGLH